ncbi:General substrate transporter [Niveomyces insectorum RCEF 264]|uniref:General substrate transporter n=1 Tax=Niveomyces insectorum RCEF 264 TaxID=1081102 RepID=A0A167NF79_9HYPO|nr:General substrate transporter [Niveomyces insectorum RCEF 264]
MASVEPGKTGTEPTKHVESAAGDEGTKSGPDSPGRNGSTALAMALAEENPRPFRKSFLKLYLCLAVAYMCSSTNGFDANTFGGLSAEPEFARYFNLTAQNNGAVVALYVVGQITGCLFAGPLSDRYGRRFGMGVGSTICIIGAAVQAAARTRQDLMAGRFVLGIGSVIANSSGPAYVVEMAYPKYRGFLTGLYQAFFFCGTIGTTWLEFGLSYLPGDSVVAWRLPLAIQAVPSIILLIGVWFIPETPRWWMAQDRHDKAREILVKYHGDGNADSSIVRLEMEEMLQVVSTSGSDKRWWDFRDLFSTPGARYRIMLVILVAWFSEIELPPTSYYLPLMVKTVGITSVKIQLLLNAVQTPLMMISSLTGLCLIDRLGRRTLLMTGSILMAISLSIITACTAQHEGRPVVSGVGIAFLYIFLAVFAFCWVPILSSPKLHTTYCIHKMLTSSVQVPNQALYPSEILAFNSRGKGLAFYNLARDIVLVINTYVPPVAIANVSWRFYIFYIVVDFFGAVAVYFLFVETRGWSLEEIEAIFNSPSPKNASLQSRDVMFANTAIDVEESAADQKQTVMHAI